MVLSAEKMICGVQYITTIFHNCGSWASDVDHHWLGIDVWASCGCYHHNLSVGCSLGQTRGKGVCPMHPTYQVINDWLRGGLQHWAKPRKPLDLVKISMVGKPPYVCSLQKKPSSSTLAIVCS